MGGRTRHDIVRRLLQKRQRATERDQFVKALDFLEAWSRIDAAPEVAFDIIRGWIAPDDTTAQAIYSDWQRLLGLLLGYGIPTEKIHLQPALARNWDYYTGIVFELCTTDGCQLGGGGRYDELAHLLGAAHDVPAVGFTYYADQLSELLAYQPEKPPTAFIIVVTYDLEAAGVHWTHALRERGYTATLSSEGYSRATPQSSTAQANAQEIVLHVMPDGAIEWAGGVYLVNAVEKFIAELENQ
jgi:histidyl-tRNA synthetase